MVINDTNGTICIFGLNMARRFYQDAGRIIISKPGFDARPALAEENKLFDSSWFFSASIIAAGSFPFGGYTITIRR